MSAPKVVETAPPKIWLQVSDDASHEDEPFPSDHEGITWCQDSVLDCQVGYVREDIARKLSVHSDSFDWLAKRYVAADFAYGEDKRTVLIFSFPEGCSLSSSLIDCIERARIHEVFAKRADRIAAVLANGVEEPK